MDTTMLLVPGPAELDYPPPCESTAEPVATTLQPPAQASLRNDKVDIERKSMPAPAPGVSEATGLGLVSHSMAMGRLRRLFQPKANGQYKVPEELVKKWNDDEGKQQIIEEFARSGFRKDWVLQAVVTAVYHASKWGDQHWG